MRNTVGMTGLALAWFVNAVQTNRKSLFLTILYGKDRQAIFFR